MRSTSTSEKQKTLIRVSRLNLVFKTDVYQSKTLRDSFVDVLSNPFRIFTDSRDRVHVAKDVSFEIAQGERVGIIGVNGAGKTSICRCLAGMYVPNTGRVETFGKVRAIFDTALGIMPELTGRENLDLLARFMFPDDPHKDELVAEAAEFSELGRFLDIRYKFYSKGMQARLCLSLISCKPCEILILDEVFDGADIFFRKKLSLRVLKMIQESGAVIFVSHSPEQIHEVCNRVILLNKGRIEFDGPVSEGIQRYQEIAPPVAMEMEQ
jgi:ABC-type polysaccharide/polyol phosphate transport system ATPase subunit